MQACVGDSLEVKDKLFIDRSPQKIFKRGKKPKKLQTDAGSEFKNKAFQTFLKNENVHHFVTYNETKAQLVERFNI